MRIVIAPDSFKGSLTAVEAADIIASSIVKVIDDAHVIKLPLSDGGEGLVNTLISACGGSIRKKQVTGPLGADVDARFGVLEDGRTAVIEMAAASGFELIPGEEKNPMLTTTYGTGELIKEALDVGCRRLIIGIGGSATNDGGAGMAQALGADFVDMHGIPLPFGGAALANLDRIDTSQLDLRLQDAEVFVACDVKNPLTGQQGASYVYGPQKGATPEMAALLDNALTRYAQVVKRDLGMDVQNVPGAGAAGGLGAGLMAFAQGKLEPGIDLVLNMVRFEKHLTACDLVVTGEGKLDDQSLFGKVPVGVSQRAMKHRVPVFAFAGSVKGSMREFREIGITACFPIVDSPMSLAEAMDNAANLLENAVVNVFKVVQCAVWFQKVR